MVLFIRFSSLLVLLSLAQVAESQVTIKPYFSSPVRVLEGEPLTLDYSIQGSFFRLEFGVSGAFFHIVEASSDGTTRPFDDRVSMNVTGTNITITYRTVYRNDSNDYTMVAVPSTQGVPPSTSDVEIIVQYPPSLTTRVQDQVVLEGGPPIQLNCTADGEPKPNITWTKITNGSNSNIPFIGETLKLDNNRSNEGRYRCSASNGIGNDVNHTAIVVVNFKPENFMFKVESSNENICKGDTLNITCSAEGKPGVHTYQLFQNNILVHTSNSSELFWSNATTVGGEVMYTCEANNTVSTANTMRTVTVNVPSFIMPISNEVITEGENLNLSCPATGIPPPTVFWIKTSTGERTNGTELFIRNISRSEAGEYRCEAMNPCGNASESATIDVQYPPEGIQLHVSEEEVCNGTTISFNCSAETANPTELNYQLYENNMMIGVVSSTGVWNKTMTVGGVFVYKCMVNNSVGTAMSSNVSVNVNVSSIIMPISTEVITEGGNLNLSCPATGIPPPTVFWVKTSNGERTSGTELVIRNINRSEAGEYRCEAMNPCGNASEFATIDVQYPPEGIQLHVSEEEVCNGTTISFNCSAETANPMELDYQLYENNVMIGVISSTGVWNKTMTVGGVFVYKCMVNNSVGTAMSSTVSVNVNVSSFIMPISTEVITEGGNLNLSCPATGIPPPTVFWVKTSNGERTNGTELVIRNINRSEAGEYRCEAMNPCGNASEFATIDVQYAPEGIQLHVSEEEVCNGTTISFNCSAETANPTELKYQLYENNMMIGVVSSTGVWNKTMTVGGVFVYKCMVNNSVGTAMSSTVSVNVNVSSFISPVSNVVITEGGNLNLSCPATGIPPPTVFWVKTSNGERTNGTELVIRNINRSEAGEYRCEAMNPCGNVSESATIDVQYPPEGIQLHVSEEEVCNGTTISFNCSAETANPMELDYQLYENNVMIGVISSTGVWNKTMTVGGVFVYKCMVNNSVGTAMSSTVSVNVNVPSFITPISNEVITEGENLNLSCPATGIPPPTVFWFKTSNGERTNGTELVIRNINRSEAGEYRCEAMNPCGNALESATIDVQYPPEGIQLHVSEEEVCNGTTISFNCSAETANPTELNYQLYENNIVIGVISSTGVWNKTMTVGGVFVYKCMVNNSVGTAMSSNVSVNVNEPSSIRPLTKKERTEGESLTIVCEATGTPPLSVSWVKTSDGVRTNGTELVFTDIIRTEAGEYRCEASNLCGNASESVEIDVFFKPEMVQLFASEETVYFGASITLNCSAYGNPMVHTYHLYENGNMVEEISSTGVWTRTMSTRGEFVFKCMVNNTVGTAMSPNVSVTVNGEKCEPTCTDGKECLAFGTKYFCRCPNEKSGENCQQNDALVKVVEVGFEFTSEEFKPEYENLEDQSTVVLIQKIKQAIQTEMTGTGLRDVIVKKLRSGSVIADVELIFNSRVAKDAIEGLIKESLKDNKLGGLDVGQFKFDGVIPEPEKKEECSQFFEGPDCKQATGALIALIVVAVVVVVALLIAIVACSLQKKNATGQASVQNGKYSQRQDPEGRHGTVGKEGNAYGGVTSGRNGHGSVNTGFEDETAQAGTPMVTFNSNNAQTPGITLNDSRSQKARPGEGTYADLGDFQQTPSSTTVTTGPLKRGPKYEETPYAEITQFLQGPVEPEKEESPVEVPVNPEGPLEEPEDEVKDDALNNLNDDARDQSNEQTKLYPSLKEVDGGNKPAQFEVSI